MLERPAKSEAKAMIGEAIRRGERLQGAASMIGDSSDHGDWQRRRSQWAESGVDTLEACFGQAAASSFERTVRPPPRVGSWFEDLPPELGRLHEGIATLKEFLARLEAAS